jgi:sugar lactone lactonase YvrE
VPLATIVLSALAFLAMPAGALGFGPLSGLGSSGEGAGQFNNPEGLAIAGDGTTYVTEFAAHRIDVFNAQGGFLFAFGKEVDPHGGNHCTAVSGCVAGAESGDAGGMSTLEGVALGPEGNLFAVDEGNRRIDVFTAGGEFLRAFGKEVNLDPNAANRDICTVASSCQEGKFSALAGALKDPIGLDSDSAGNLFVADFGTNRIDVFTTGGEFLRAFGKEVNLDQNAANRDVCTLASGCQGGRGVDTAGGLAEPTAVKSAPNGELVVGDFQNDRIDVFTAGGEFLRAFGKEVNPDQSAANRDVCTLASGCQAGTSSAVAGAFRGPNAVAIDSGDEIYVADEELNRIDQFSIDGSFIRAFGTGVIDGSEAFQVCTLTCQQGSASQAPGSISSPTAVALDCRGALYTTAKGKDFAHVERFGEPGTPSAPCTPPAPSNEFKIGKLKLNRKRGTATLLVEVPGAGTVLLRGKGLRRVTRSARRAGRILLPVRPVGRFKRRLDRTGVVRLRALLTYTPTGGSAATQAKKLALRKTLRRGPRRR